jgi:catalase (peroxidase I)
MCSLVAEIQTEFNNVLQGKDAVARSQLFGASLRLAFHDAGEVNLPLAADTLGPDGCLSMTGSENKGLIEANEEVNSIIEVSWQKFCGRISRADFWALWGKLTAERASGGQLAAVEYFYGRADNTQCNAGAGRLPSALLGLSHIETVFVTQMGLTMHDAVALIGAHSVGHMSLQNSGFVLDPAAPRTDGTIQANAWDTSPQTLDNRYYAQLLGVRWDLTPANTFHSQQYTRGGPGTVMLNADMSLAFQNIPNEVACGGNARTCGRVASTADQIASYVADNQVFLADFSQAYTKMVNAGYGYTDPVTKQVFSGKLGQLEYLDCVA